MPMKRIVFFLAVGIALSFLVFVIAKEKLREINHAFFFQSDQAFEPDSLNLVPGFHANPMTTSKQFLQFPLPQFSLNHGFNANFLWMDPSYFGGMLQANLPAADAVKNSVFIQEQLARYWNYSIMVNNNTKVHNKYNEPSSFVYNWVKLANEHPEWPASAITFWGQVRPRHLHDDACVGDRPYISRSNLPDSLYLAFNPGDNHKTKRINPAISSTNFNCDRLTQRKYVKLLLASLKRPLNYINENGEVFHLINDAKLEQDDLVKKDRKNYPGLTTYEYQSTKRYLWEVEYRDAFMTDSLLHNTHYSVYSIDGYEQYRHAYGILRNVQTPMRGMRYSTPDFYPRWPSNWRRMKGPWHGLAWIEECRDKETTFGDHLFSPFVAAGWDKDETKNLMPGQWLGLMKILTVFGAEFFYTGYFNEKMPPNDPRNYCWQSVIPSYAQASFSYYPKVLLEGETQKNGEWFLKSNNEKVVALVRKHKSKQQYLISLTLQHHSNDKNNSKEEEVLLEWKEKTILIKARVQGSVYYVDLTNAAHPIVIALDAWHQWEHPARWSKEHWVEASLQQDGNKIHSSFSRKGNEWDWRDLKNQITLLGNEVFPIYWQKRLNDRNFNLQLDVDDCKEESVIQLVEDGKILLEKKLKTGINDLAFTSKDGEFDHLNLTIKILRGSFSLSKWKIQTK